MKRTKETTKNIIELVMLITSIIAGLGILLSVPFVDSESPLPMIILIGCVAWLIFLYVVIRYSGKFNDLL